MMYETVALNLNDNSVVVTVKGWMVQILLEEVVVQLTLCRSYTDVWSKGRCFLLFINNMELYGRNFLLCNGRYNNTKRHKLETITYRLQQQFLALAIIFPRWKEMPTKDLSYYKYYKVIFLYMSFLTKFLVFKSFYFLHKLTFKKFLCYKRWQFMKQAMKIVWLVALVL